MASLWEIHDPTSLRYDRDLGLTQDDSGFGPPATPGWIRTGSFALSSGPAGLVNCGAWTSANAIDNGTTVSPPGFWTNPGATSSPWASNMNPCSTPEPVWCVQD